MNTSGAATTFSSPQCTGQWSFKRRGSSLEATVTVVSVRGELTAYDDRGLFVPLRELVCSNPSRWILVSPSWDVLELPNCGDNPPLAELTVGSSRQIAWAESIRGSMLRSSFKDSRFVKLAAAVKTINDATWWIANRDRRVEDMRWPREWWPKLETEAPAPVQRPGSGSSDSQTFSLVEELLDALKSNAVFHTPIALRRKLPISEWDEYEADAISRTRAAIEKAERWMSAKS